MAPVNPQEVQTLQNYLKQYNQQAEVFSRQLSLMEDGIREGSGAIETLQAVRDAGEATILMPIGGGLNIRAKIEDPEQVFVNIGADIILEKNNDGAISYLQDRIKEMEASAKNLNEAIAKVDAQIKDLSRRLEQLYRQAQAEQQAAGGIPR
jgi:prefoldin alpha subunit